MEPNNKLNKWLLHKVSETSLINLTHQFKPHSPVSNLLLQTTFITFGQGLAAPQLRGHSCLSFGSYGLFGCFTCTIC